MPGQWLGQVCLFTDKRRDGKECYNDMAAATHGGVGDVQVTMSFPKKESKCVQCKLTLGRC